MDSISKDILVTLLILSCGIHLSKSFNVGISEAKVFSGPVGEQFGYTVQQFINHQGKWLLVGSPKSGYPQNQKGDVYRCPISGSRTNCDKLKLQNYVRIPSVKNINTNMSLGLTLTPLPKTNGFMACGPLWAQQCGSQYFYPGICIEVSPLFIPLTTFSPAIQTCGGPMDIALVLDGSNSIWPWVHAFLPENGGRAGAAKVMVVVTDGESHDKEIREQVMKKCEEKGITRFGIAGQGKEGRISKWKCLRLDSALTIPKKRMS
ncbi:hypothetical protein AAFF_G00315230 [Aldrovandia affinis]|uniref:VWFA domain-containing protein n=1 Tax=Aldrovandia affinis TaxID=143900 RepID=A0AAD7SNS1_9TELE|nr:hypothetical protein AAFF_G00315230 [Aldrovandia affinis]